MPHNQLEGLVSWLKLLDVEYLDDQLIEELSLLNINTPADRKKVIELAVLPEFNACNQTSQASMLHILKLALEAHQSEIEPFFERVGMPFSEPLVSGYDLLKEIHEAISTNV